MSDFDIKNPMNTIFRKISNSIRADGFLYTIYRCLRFPFVRLKSFRNRKKIFASTSAPEIFTKIYEVNWWGSSESLSGHGSTLLYTENLRKELPRLFQEFFINSVFDAPCGDFNWMKKVVGASGISYVGGDIVPQLIERNQATFADDKINFILLNIITDKFPKADLWICRDCLFHLSFEDIYLTLKNFTESEISYILTTTHNNTSGFKNLDIRTGDVRLIDLFSAPFFFPNESKYRINDWMKPHPPREMVLFDRVQISQSLPRMKLALGL